MPKLEIEPDQFEEGDLSIFGQELSIADDSR